MSWNDAETEDGIIYKVVLNHEEQYSILPAYKENALGWRDGGKTGTKAECLAYIQEVWTDMRPLSLRKKMEEFAKNPPPPATSRPVESAPEKSLVDRLCEGDQAIEVGLRPEKNAQRLKESVDRDYVHIKFPNTKGGTELGVRLDRGACDFHAADFDNGKGTAHMEGYLTLDYVKVKCIADIDLGTLAGHGRLTKVEAAV